MWLHFVMRRARRHPSAASLSSLVGCGKGDVVDASALFAGGHAEADE